MNIASLILKFCGLGFVIGAGGLWAGAGVDSRPKNRDEQTLVGGAIWTQILIPTGLIISAIVDEELDTFVHAYFLLAGWILLGSTGVILIIGECKKLKKQRRATTVLDTVPPQLRKSFDKIISACLGFIIVCGFKLDLLIKNSIIITGLLAFGAYWTTKYIMNLADATTESTLNVHSSTIRHRLYNNT